VSSPEQLDVVRARFPRRCPAAFEVPIGLNVEAATGDRPQVRADVRRELGVAPDAPVVVFFGLLHPEKALDRLITAVAAIAAHRPGVQLLLIGGVESHSVPGAAALRLRRWKEIWWAIRAPTSIPTTEGRPVAVTSRSPAR
jgi:glycosyltransferase involved in cell wall biosynthesis